MAATVLQRSLTGPFLSCRPVSFGAAEPDALGHLASWGVRYVEVALPQASGTAELQRQLRAHGIQCGSMQVECPIDDAALPQHMGEAARRATQEFGTPYMFTSVRSGAGGPSAAYDALRRVGEAIAREGATLLVETHPDLGTNGTVAAATMSAVDHPSVRSNWDAANVFYYNEQSDPVAEFERALPYIGALHLKDSHGRFHAWDFGALGDGVVPFAHMLRRLSETGFHGPCTMEIEGIEGETLTAEEHVRRVERSVDYLRRLGYFSPE